jgi:site-specific DNA recombinase
VSPARVGIYCRRSTDHQDTSLEVQETEARRFCSAKGWTVVEVYREDAVSRSEFVNRPELARMINAAADRALDVVVIRDHSRLGGDMARTQLVMLDLIESGAELWTYADGQQVRMESSIDRFLQAAVNFASEHEAEKLRSRVREKLVHVAQKGGSPGGKAYGYRNIRRADGTPDLDVDPEQAETVRQIFGWFASGLGHTQIAHRLNNAGTPPPRAGRRGTGSWSPSQVRSMLANERYNGVLTYGRVAKAYRGGTKVRRATEPETWIHATREDLRIIPADLWGQVAERRERNSRLFGTDSKRGATPRYLLTGIARCAECGGRMEALKTRFGSRTQAVYCCAYARRRGPAVCGNTLRRPVEGVDRVVTDWIRWEILTEQTVVAVIAELKARFHTDRRTHASEVQRLERERTKLRKAAENGAAALLTLGQSPALVQALRQAEARLGEVEAQIVARATEPEIIDLGLARLEAEARRRIADLSGLLARNPTEARRVMEAVFATGLVMTPIRDRQGPRFKIEGLATTGALLCGTTNDVPRGI